MIVSYILDPNIFDKKNFNNNATSIINLKEKIDEDGSIIIIDEEEKIKDHIIENICDTINHQGNQEILEDTNEFCKTIGKTLSSDKRKFTFVDKPTKNPKFIESHRLSDFNPRGTDVSVIMDLMIHDIDIILSINKSNIKKIDASGVSIISSTPDIANARIEFEDGCIANLTSSRISLKKMRKTRIFQEDAYISINFLEKEFQVVKIRDKYECEAENSLIVKNNLGEEKVIFFENPKVQSINSIEAELNDFYESIKFKSHSKVSLNDGIKALEVAEEIMRQL